MVKPQREGGGNNFYDDEVRTVLATMPPAELASYILMQRIWPASQLAMLVRDGACRTGPAVSERAPLTSPRSRTTRPLAAAHVSLAPPANESPP